MKTQTKVQIDQSDYEFQNYRDDNKQCDIFEVLAGEIFMRDDRDFDERCDE